MPDAGTLSGWAQCPLSTHPCRLAASGSFRPIADISGHRHKAAVFTYDEIVRVRTKAPADMRPGELAWVIGIIGPDDGQPVQFKQLPTGIVYTVEFEDGEAIDIHESMLEASKTNAWDLVFHGLDAFVRWLIIFMAGAYSARWLVDNLTGFSLIFALLIWAAVLAAVVHYSRKT